MAQESWKRDQEETGCQPPEGPVLCANNCGFFGSATTMNLCSQCYKSHVLKQSKASAVKVAMEKTVVGDFLMPRADQAERQLQHPEVPAVAAVATAISVAVEGSVAAVAAVAAGPSQPQQQPNRCFSCKKRVGLTGFKCRCGNTFCSLHRYSDKHSCSFDYKTAGRDAIAKANPVVKADKIDKI